MTHPAVCRHAGFSTTPRYNCTHTGHMQEEQEQEEEEGRQRGDSPAFLVADSSSS